MLLTIEQEKQLDNWFSYHPPSLDQAERYEVIREAGKRLAGSLLWKSTEEVSSLINYVEETINLLCPDSAEREYALENLEKIYNLYMQGNDGFAIAVLRFSVIMPANAAIACNEHEVGIDM